MSTTDMLPGAATDPDCKHWRKKLERRDGKQVRVCLGCGEVL